MQAKKFEAKSMREALHLVKTNLGPEAIVLGFKEKRIWGEKKGLEITAVVSEGDLKKKKFAESKLKEEDKEKFQKSSAKVQIEFIEKTLETLKEKKSFKNITVSPYISIADEEEGGSSSSEVLSSEVLSSSGSSSVLPRPMSLKKDKATISPLNVPPFSMKRKWISSKSVSERSSQKTPRSQRFQASSFEQKERLSQVERTKTSQERRAKKHASPAFSTLPEGEKKDTLYLKNLFDRFKKKNHYFVEWDFIRERLSKKSLSSQNIKEILSLLEQNFDPASFKDKNRILGFVAEHFLKNLEVCSHLQEDKFQFFVGPPGVGKTSSLIKTAISILIEEKKKVALVNTNQRKIGVSQEFKIFSRILNIPFFQISHARDFHEIKKEIEDLRKNEIDVFLIDGPMLSRKSDGIQKQENSSSLLEEGIRIHYVQSLLHDERSAFEMAKASRIPFHDVIFTYLDESHHYGKIYNFQKTFSCPLHSFSLGDKIPEDFEWATKERFLDLIFDFSRSREEEKDEEEKVGIKKEEIEMKKTR